MTCLHAGLRTYVVTVGGKNTSQVRQHLVSLRELIRNFNDAALSIRNYNEAGCSGLFGLLGLFGLSGLSGH